ncbi:solute carrier family 15 member 4-like [Diadema antillarum]|uniref:solute carrier family 15 member 4-like n=1 Tax=Diadema antillarum TaxID=105358 RepID=UPI003A842464
MKSVDTKPLIERSTSLSSTKSYGADFELTSSSSTFVNRDPSEQEQVKRTSSILDSVWLPVAFIFGFTFFVTIAEHGVRYNIVLYSEDELDYRKGNAPVLIHVFDAVAPCLPMIGGWLADTRFPRLKVLITGGIITFMGTLLLLINVAPYSEDVDANFPIMAKRGLFVVGFTAIFVGLALYAANECVMAAREVEREREKDNIRNVFFVFYAVYFSAVFFSQLMFPLIKATSFFVVYLVVVSCVFLAIVSALIGRKLYVTETRNKTILRQQFKVIWEALRRRKDVPSVDHWLDRASVQHGGSFTGNDVYETAHLLRTTPIFHTVTIFIIVNYFMENTYSAQTICLNPAGETDINTTKTVYLIYQSFVSVVTNIMFLVILLPKCLARHARFVSPFLRIGGGIIMGILSVCFAALVEGQRKRLTEEEPMMYVSMDNVTTCNSSSLSAVAQIPQYTCAGIGDGLVLSAGLEVSYTEAPLQLKGFTVGLFLLMSGVGSYLLAQLIVAIVNAISGAAGQPWYSTDINSARLEYFYPLLAGILLLDILYLYLVTRKYKRANWWSLEQTMEEEMHDGNAAMTQTEKRRDDMNSSSVESNSNGRSLQTEPD